MASMRLFYFLLFLVCTIIAIQCIEVIQDVWYDDFAVDSQGLDGWDIYYHINANRSSYPIIPFVNGSLGKYHGVYHNGETSTHYLKRTFQCKNDSSIKLGYNMAYCGNQAYDLTQVHMDNNFKFVIDFLSENKLYPLNDALIKSNYSYICDADQWYIYYDTANPRQLESFVIGGTSFHVQIEVTLSAINDVAAINDITIFCDPPIITNNTTSSPPTHNPTSSPTQPTSAPTPPPSNIIIDTWYDDFLYDVNGVNGWNTFYVSGSEYEYSPDINPLVYGQNTYHGIYNGYTNILYRRFQCQNGSNLTAKYSIVYCGNEVNDYFDLAFNGVNILSIFMQDGANFSDNAVTNNNFFCQDGYSWRYHNFATSIGFVSGYTEFELQFEYRLSMGTEYGALYNISIICESFTTRQPTTSQPTTSQPTTSLPTTTVPTTDFPTTLEPTTDYPTKEASTSDNPTTGIPTTANPTTDMPTTTAIETSLFPNPTMVSSSTTTLSTSSTSIRSIYTTKSTKKATTTTSAHEHEHEISITNTSLSSVPSSAEVSDNTSNNMIVLIISIVTAILIIFCIIGIIVCFTIYKKKKNKICKEVESLSNIQMTVSNPNGINKNSANDNDSSIINKLEIDDDSENSIEGIFVKPIISMSTHGETSMGGTTNAESVAIGTQNNDEFINNDSDENDDSVDIMYSKRPSTKVIEYNTKGGYDNDDDNDGSGTERLYDDNENRTTKGLENNNKNLDNIFFAAHNAKQSNDIKTIEGYIEKKDDNVYLESDRKITKGTDTGDDV